MKFWVRHSETYDSWYGTPLAWHTKTEAGADTPWPMDHETPKKADQFCKDNFRLLLTVDGNSRPRIDSFIVYYFDESGIKHEPKLN